MEQQQKLTREQIVEQEMGPVYDFFVHAERLGKHFSYKKICEVYPHDIKTIRKYAQNYWSWFLLQEGKSKPFIFSCHGLIDYPKQYFLDAHKPHQGRYFYHFAVAMQKAAAARNAERQRAQEEAKARAQQLELPAIGEEQLLVPQETAETLVPEQELPELVHIETIEDEMEENGESNGNGSLVALASMSPVVDELPSGEDGPENVNHPGDGAFERIEDVSSPAPLSKEELQPIQTTVVSSPGKRQQEGQKGFPTRTFVTVAVCLVVVVGLTIWWVASKR